MIYFVQADIIGRIKIGYSSLANHHRRIETLQTACPVKLRVLLTIKGGRSKEARLHERFAEDRVQGEWFEPSPRLVEFIFRLSGRKARQQKPRPARRCRQVVARDWLIERFREKREWDSNDLMAAARQTGISKNAIYEAKTGLQFPKPRPEVAGGCQRWVWWVPEDWAVLLTEGA